MHLQVKDTTDGWQYQELGERPGTEFPSELQQKPTTLPTPCCQTSGLTEMPVV